MLNQPRRSLLTQRPSKMRVGKGRGDPFCRINATPLAGILLALWLLFAAMLPGLDMSVWHVVELVDASHSVPIPGAMRDDAILVGLGASGDVYFGSSHITLHELESKIREGLKSGAETRVYLNVDSRAKYRDLKSILPQIFSAGIENITFITK